MIQVSIEWKKIHSGSHTLSIVARIHEPHFAYFKPECKVNLDAVCIISAKIKEPSKLLKGDLIPPSLGHSMEFSYVPPILNKQSGIELSYYLVVPILLKGRDIPQELGSTSSHYLIKDPVTPWF
jgi:hypothetical protein